MSFGDRRYYRISQIQLRHFYQAGQKAGMHEQDMESIFSELVVRVKDAITEAATLAGDAGMLELNSEPILADVSKRAEMIRKGMIQFL